jgi:hypothetical protein
MLIAANSVIGSTLQGVDGYLGTLKDVLFDDAAWCVRYLTIDTGKWLPGRKVLLAPAVIEQAEWPAKTLEVRQTRQQIIDSPPLSEHEPVSRQHELELANYFQWPSYWGQGGPLGPVPMAGVPGFGSAPKPSVLEKDVDEADKRRVETADNNLRSVKELIGYQTEASDGDVGHVQDFILDDETWAVRYLVIDTKRWLPWGSVLVSPAWVTSVSWDDSKLRVDLTRAQIKGSPEFDPREPINRRYEEQLYNYYGLPAYWR